MIFPAAVCAQNHIDLMMPDWLSEELAEPENWVAHGGCWTFTDSGIIAQAGIMGRHLIYYNKKRCADFELQVRLNKLAEGGPLGLVVRFDERKKEGYTYLVYPHGQYCFTIIKEEPDYTIFTAPVNNMNQDVNVWNTVKIVCIGSTFELYMNDQLLTAITDKSYKNGRFGIFLAGDPRQKAIFKIISLKEFKPD